MYLESEHYSHNCTREECLRESDSRNLKNNLHLLDEHKLLYTAGHNAVVYSNESMNASDSTQYFLPGLEKTDKITAVGVSKSKKFLAICEKTDRALCTIYDVHS